MLRSILAVVAGTLVLLVAAMTTDAVLLKLFPTFTDAQGRISSNAVAFLMMSYAIAYCALAGYVAALVARRREVAHALALGVVLTLALIFPTIKFWDTTPAWYHVALFVLTIPACVAGGRWRELQKSRRTISAATAPA
jgi:peptidoglycan/LPS O-acetylase OafA/YrhL